MNTSRLETFARLMATGSPPALAAKAAGYRNLRASRAATRLGRRPAGPNGPGAAAEKAPVEPMMSEAQWLAAFAPASSGETGRRA